MTGRHKARQGLNKENTALMDKKCLRRSGYSEDICKL